jgi:hypothetical protein
VLPVSSTVYLERDQKDTDGKNRLLRYVWIANPNTGKADLVNVRVVRYGYAGWVSKDGNAARDAELEAAQRKAEESKEGIWLECGGPHAEKPLLACQYVPKATMDAIRATFVERFEPQVWATVISRANERYPYIVAARGPVSQMSDTTDPDFAVWAVDDLEHPTRIATADIMAGAFSTATDGSTLDPMITESTLGVSEALACVGYVPPDE